MPRSFTPPTNPLTGTTGPRVFTMNSTPHPFLPGVTCYEVRPKGRYPWQSAYWTTSTWETAKHRRFPMVAVLGCTAALVVGAALIVAATES